MHDLAWNWLAAPYVLCALAVLSVGATAVLIRGDRVLRLGMIGAAASALPWAVTSALSACTHDPELATRLLRLGTGPIALVGPDLLLVLLGVSGQLERQRWLARSSAVLGGLLVLACWLTDWTVPGVRVLPSGMFYIRPGPLAGLHTAQLGGWLAIGIAIVRRSTPSAERRRLARLLLAVLALGTIGGSDVLILYDVAGWYPIAWLAATIASAIVIYLCVRTDMLRPVGFDRGALIEVASFALATVAIGAIAFALPGATPLPFAAIGSVVWVIATASAWAIARGQRPAKAAGRLDDLVVQLAELTDEGAITERVGAAWHAAIGIEPVATWFARDAAFEPLYGGTRWDIPPEVVAWLARRAEPLAINDLATMRLGALRPAIEALGSAHGASLIVPLVDRGALVGVIEALYDRALREAERGLVATSARAAARQLTFVRLSREAAQEGDSAREVEVAEAMRLQATASRDDELGRWAVVAEYRSATRTTGAGWSATLLDDGRLAVLVTEAQGKDVPAALATAALTGAFAAATSSNVTMDELLTSLRASADGVYRGGEPVAAFVAILDADHDEIEWGSAGHPGAHVMPMMPLDASMSVPRPIPIALGGGGGRLGATMAIVSRGKLALPSDAMLIVASSALRGGDAIWATTLRELAPAGAKLASIAVERAVARGVPDGADDEDLLAVVVKRRV